MKAVIVSVMVLTLALCSSSKATDFATSVGADTPKQELMKVSQDGFDAMRTVRAARIAIFNGEPKLAIKMLGKAKVELDAAAKDASKFIENIKTMVGEAIVEDKTGTAKMDWIPIDGQVSLANTFVPSPEKTEHINKANEYFKKGRSKEAIEELRLAEIDVTYTCVLMPLQATTKCVAEATRLAEEHKYYEANLALKVAEDGLIIDSVSLIAMPKHKSKENSPKVKSKKNVNWK